MAEPPESGGCLQQRQTLLLAGGVACVAVLAALGCSLPMWSIELTVAGASAETSFRPFSVCAYASGEQRDCRSWQEHCQDVCGTLSQRLSLVRVTGVAAVVAFALAALLCAERHVECVAALRGYTGRLAPRALMFCGGSLSLVAFTAIVLLFSTPNDCCVATPNAAQGATIGAAPFLFATACVAAAVAFVVDRSAAGADDDDDGGGRGDGAATHVAFETPLNDAAPDAAETDEPGDATPES